MHKFSLKQLVLFVGGAGVQFASGSFEVLQLLPPDASGDLQYRIKSNVENYERVVRESQLLDL